MPRRAWKPCIEDNLGAIGRIDQYTLGKTQHTFVLDQQAVDAVLYNLIVIGEAVVRVPDTVRHRHPSIPWSKMRALRNVVVHEYPEVDPDIIWETARNDIPPLRTLLLRVAEEPM